MHIETENYTAYEIRCDCGAHFMDDGRLGVVSCPACGESEDALTLVEQWWSAAGWSVADMVVLAPTAITVKPARAAGAKAAA